MIQLASLILDQSEIDQGESVTINILNATEGSTITGTMPPGLTLDSAARTISGAATTIAANSIDLTETLVGAENNPRISTVSLEVVSGAPTIISNASVTVAENTQLAHVLQADEAVTWAITGGADASEFEINGATLRWASDGTRNFEASADVGADNQYDVDITATDGSSNETPQSIQVSVTNVFEQASLGTLSINPSTITENEAVTINILGATAGSTLAVTTGALPAGMTLNSAARTITGTPTTIESAAFEIEETLADSANSPNDTALTATVEAAPVPSLIDTTDMTQHRTIANSELIDADSFQFYRDGGLIGDIRFTLPAGNYRVTADLSVETLSGTSFPVQFRMMDTGTQLIVTSATGSVSFDITTTTTSLRFLNGTNAGCRVDNFKIVALP